MAKPSFQEFYQVAQQSGAPSMNSARELYVDTFGDDASVWAGPTRDQFLGQAKLNADRMGQVYDEDEATSLYDDNYNEDTLSSMRRGLMRGAGMATEALGTHFQMGGLDEFGGRIAGKGEQTMEDYPQSPYGRSVDFKDDFWGSMANSDYWTGTIPEQLPVMGLPYLAGAVGGPVGYGLGTAGGAAIEASQVYRDARKKDWSHEQAMEAYWKTLGMDATMQAATGGVSKLAQPLGKPLRAGITGAAEATTEIAEEGVAEMNLGGDFLEGMEKGINVGPVAFAMGAGGSLMDRSAPAPVEPEPSLVPETVTTEQTAEDIIKGNWESGKLYWSPADDQNAGPVQQDLFGEDIKVSSPLEQYNAVDESTITNPVEPSLSPLEKATQMHNLGLESQPIIQELMADIDKSFPGAKSNDNFKKIDNIVSKAERPSILANKPWHGVEHIRDSYRFKTDLDDITALPGIVDKIRGKGIEIVKSDTDKVLNPGPWGWRIAAFDLRMPNGLLVEYYLPVRELEAAKHIGHKMFEQWRNQDLNKLSPEKARHFFKTLQDSNRLYDGAWKRYLKRKGQSEADVLASLNNLAASAGPTRTNRSAKSSADQAAPAAQPSGPLENIAPSGSTMKTSPARDADTIASSDIGITSTGIVPAVAQPVYQYDANSLRGKDITYEVYAQDTQETFTVTEDAGKAMKKLYNRQESLQELRACVS